MAKRRPGSELNDRNWDVEEEPEEAGVFTKATTDVMQQRIIKKAKRHTAPQGDSNCNGSKPSVFSGFAGLSKTSQPKNSSSNGSGTFSSKPFTFGGASSSNGAEETKEQTDDSKYLQSLKALNESVLDWIKQHVEKNPYISLSPIFKDYESYMENIEAKKSSLSTLAKIDEIGESQITFSAFRKEEKNEKNESKESSKQVDKPFTFGASAVAEEKPVKSFSLGGSSSSANGGFKFSTTSSTAGFSFNKTESSKETDDKKPFSFGLSGAAGSDNKEEKKPFSFAAGSDNKEEKKPFSFAAGSGNKEEKKPFSFGIASLGASGTSTGTTSQSSKDDEDYVPPKPEVKEIKEDDALFSIRCKLYYQKEGGWTERGVGNLHLKPVSENKTQLLIRADTNLGNILLNIMLSESLPTKRQGKNNVFVVCVPNPPISGKPDAENAPTPMLIRVKTGDDADELLSKIEERKKLLA